MMVLNVLRVFWGGLKYYAFGLRTPLNVGLRITNQCNSKCKYCFVRDRPQREMTTEEIKKVIDGMHSMGTQRVGIQGGEVFLRDDAEEIVRYIKSCGMHLSLVTNGLLVPDNMKMVRMVDCLVVSFDGREKGHENNRIVGGHKAALNAIRAARSNGVLVLTITVITKNNINDIDYILETAKERGFACMFNLLHGADVFPEMGGMLPTKGQYRRAILNIMKKKREGYPVVLSYKSLRHMLNWEDYRRTCKFGGPGEGRCLAGKLFCNIDTDGTLSACDISKHFSEKIDITKHGFRSAWLRLGKQKLPCSSCACSALTDYNNMLLPDVGTVGSWLRFLFRL